MNVVKSASASDIESANYVFSANSRGEFTLIKTCEDTAECIGRSYPWSITEAFAASKSGTRTLIIEGGYDMSTESNEIATNNQRTITLVTIPPEVADAIVGLRKLGWKNAELLSAAVTGGYSGARISVIAWYASSEVETLLSALVNGYVVEKSAEELAHDAIRAEYAIVGASISAYNCGLADGITFTLDKLGISIEGVNA